MTEPRIAYLVVLHLSDNDDEPYPCNWTEKIVVAAQSYAEAEAAVRAMIQARKVEGIDQIESISIIADGVSTPTGEQL